MEHIARVIPVKSKEALMKLAKAVGERPKAERDTFLSNFGPNTIERWYFQEIDGKPYILATAEGENLGEGFAKYPELDDPYFNWFCEEVLELSGVDLRQLPMAASSTLITEIAN